MPKKNVGTPGETPPRKCLPEKPLPEESMPGKNGGGPEKTTPRKRLPKNTSPKNPRTAASATAPAAAVPGSRKPLPPLLLPRYDRVFKKIFGARRNTAILRSLLSAVLDLPAGALAAITVEDPGLRIGGRGADKSPVLDLKLTLADGTGIDVELQVARVPDMKERIVFCSSKLVAEQLAAGNDYGKLRRVIAVVITYFDLTGDPGDYHHRFFLHDEKRGLRFTNLMEIDIVEVTKLPKEGDGTPLWLWGRFFKAETEEEFDMLAKKDADVEKAVTIIRRLSGSERERRLADMEELARMDEVAGRRVAYNEGIAKGKAEGIAEGKAEGIAEGKAELEKAKNEFAKSLLGSNVPVDTISKATGLSRKDIERLR